MMDHNEKFERKLGKEIAEVTHEKPDGAGQKPRAKMAPMATERQQVDSRLVRLDDDIMWSYPLSQEQVRKIIGLANDVELLLFHLGEGLGLRSSEILRLTIDCVETCYLRVPEKEKRKFRRLPFGDDPDYVLPRYLSYRDTLIGEAWEKNPQVVIPNALLIYERDGILNPMTKNMIDRIILRLSIRSGVRFNNRTLRRTYVQKLLDLGVPLGVISVHLGQNDFRLTQMYIDMNGDLKMKTTGKE